MKIKKKFSILILSIIIVCFSLLTLFVQSYLSSTLISNKKEEFKNLIQSYQENVEKIFIDSVKDGKLLASKVAEWYRQTDIKMWNRAFQKKYRLGKDKTIRYYSAKKTGIGTFISNIGKFNNRTKRLILATENRLGVHADVARLKFLDTYLITPEQMLRIDDNNWPRVAKADFNFHSQIFYKIATPKENPEKKSVWTPLYYDPVLKYWMISNITPIYNGNDFLGIIGHDIILDEIFNIFSHNESKVKGSQHIILSQDGTIIYHPDYIKKMKESPKEWLLEKKKDTNLLKQINKFYQKPQSQKVYSKLFSQDDEEYLLTFAYMKAVGWYYVQLIPLRAVLSEIRTVITIMVITILLVGLLILGVIFGLFNIILVPVKKLGNIFSKMSSGNLQETIIDGKLLNRNDEIGVLTKTFNEMKNKISEQVKELRNSKKKYQEIFNTVSDAIFVHQLETGVIIDVNESMLQMYHCQKKDVIGKRATAFSSQIPPYTDETAIKMIHKAVQEGPQTFKWQAKKSAGELFWVEVSLRMSTEEKEKKIIASVRDITKREQTEREKEKLQEELHQSRKMDAIGKLAGGVAHDFNNMLSGIMNAAQLLKSPRRHLDEKSIKYVNMIFEASKRASSLTSKLLSFARKQDVAFSTVDLSLLLESTSSLLKNTIDKNIEIIMKQNAPYFFVQGNQSELQNILINLAVNGADAMPKGGTLSIETMNISLDEQYCSASTFDISPGRYINILIKDTGEGIAPENLKRIFEPFFTTKETGKGTGLGLATVYGAVQKHKGEMLVESQIGRGTSFSILLPCSDEKLLKASRVAETIQKGSGTILIVDDEAIIRETVGRMLEEIGYQVILAESGEKAIEVYQERFNEIDIIILDMIMPKMNGLETYHKLKEINNKSKILVSSGFAKSEHLIEIQNAGIEGIINKPFKLMKLSQLLQKVLQ